MSSEIAEDETKNKEQRHTIVKKELETKELETKELETKELETNEYDLEEKKEESNITKMKNQKEMEERTEMEDWKLLFRYDPLVLDVLDVSTLVEQWKHFDSKEKVRKVDDAVQTLLDHVQKGNKLKVANSFVSIFETLARKQHGLRVAKDEDNDNTSTVEVWISDITVHVVV